MNPLRLRPVYKDTVWANHHLSDIRNLNDPKMGIAREVCAYKGSENIVDSGPYRGEKIIDVIHAHHDEIMGKDPNDQLLRVAYMDSKDTLSIQVHPNATQAAKIGDYEKTESWYILEAEPGAHLVAGVNCSDKEVIRKAAQDGTLEPYLVHHNVQAGDFVLIPANLVHANGAGMLVVEIGSFGGITYRLYDFGRGRELDLDHGIAVMNPSLATHVTHHPFPMDDKNHIETGVDCSLFHVDIVDVSSNYTFEKKDGYYVIICVKGSCVAAAGGEEYPLGYTETLFVPATSPNVAIQGNCRLLVANYKY